MCIFVSHKTINKMKILGFTEEITTCDRCGKSELKGVWCIENSNGDLFRLGSSCIHKKFELEPSFVKEKIKEFKQLEKNNSLYELHIQPLKDQLKNKLDNSFACDYENLSGLAKKMYDVIVNEYNRVIELKKIKYKIY